MATSKKSPNSPAESAFDTYVKQGYTKRQALAMVKGVKPSTKKKGTP